MRHTSSTCRDILAAEGYDFTNNGLEKIVVHALALGFKEKWPEWNMENICHEKQENML
jgi:hypothetical protein